MDFMPLMAIRGCCLLVFILCHLHCNHCCNYLIMRSIWFLYVCLFKPLEFVCLFSVLFYTLVTLWWPLDQECFFNLWTLCVFGTYFPKRELTGKPGSFHLKFSFTKEACLSCYGNICFWTNLLPNRGGFSYHIIGNIVSNLNC